MVVRQFFHLASRGFLFLGLLVAWAEPARADFTGWTVEQGQVNITESSIQFSYQWGRVAKVISAPAGTTVSASVTIDNTTANTIGYQGQTADEWTITFSSGQEAVTVSGNEIGTTQQTVQVVVPEGSDSAVLRIAGIDNGY